MRESSVRLCDSQCDMRLRCRRTQEVSCEPSSSRLSAVNVMPFSATITIDIDCTNPNPYDLSILPAQVGSVYMGSSRQDIGNFTVQKSLVPAGLTAASIQAHAKISLGLVDTQTIASAFLIYFDLNFKVLIERTSIIGNPTTFDIAVSKKCGMYMRVSILTQDAGDCVCSGDAFENLQVPDLNTLSEDDPGFMLEVSEEKISQAEFARDSLGGALASIGGCCGLALWTFAVISCIRNPARSTAASATDSTVASTIGCEGVMADSVSRDCSYGEGV